MLSVEAKRSEHITQLMFIVESFPCFSENKSSSAVKHDRSPTTRGKQSQFGY